jgi:uncharacterized LabA/DUF88 family protein
MYRVMAYIDGFNLYNGLKSGYDAALELARLAKQQNLLTQAKQLESAAHSWKQTYWLNLQALSSTLLTKQQQLIYTKYFTSRVTTSAAKTQRQATYIDALKTLNNLTVTEGFFLFNDYTCPRCKRTYKVPHEKRTDVSISVELLIDAIDDSYDTALVISGDSDLAPAVEAVLRRFPTKRVVVAFPPNRYSNELKQKASHTLPIGKNMLRRCRLPEQITTPSGILFECPKEWR